MALALVALCSAPAAALAVRHRLRRGPLQLGLCLALPGSQASRARAPLALRRAAALWLMGWWSLAGVVYLLRYMKSCGAW